MAFSIVSVYVVRCEEQLPNETFPMHSCRMQVQVIIFIFHVTAVIVATQGRVTTVAQKGHTCKLKMLLQIKNSACKLKIVQPN